MKKIGYLLFVFYFLVSPTEALAQPREVHILSANDMHASLGSMPQLAAIADSLRDLYPSLLIFSAGDNRTGNPLNDKNAIPGYPMVALMNQIGFNASAVGNHEFDAHSLARLTHLSNFRYICANMFPDDSTGISVVPCQTFDVDGVKVGVIGAVQLSHKGIQIPSTHPDNVHGVTFKPANEVIGQYEWVSKECDVTLLLSHVGYEGDVELAHKFPWLDLIIGGHTHTQLKGDEYPNNVLITQNKNKLPCVTHITLIVDSGQVVDKRAEYINVKTFSRKNDLVKAMVQFFNDNPDFQRVIAKAETPFEEREELGCMICDAFIDEFGVDFAVENPGGVRIDSHPAGDITILDVMEMDPFDNDAVVIELTGEELVTMMLSYCRNVLTSFPFVGGFKCELTPEDDNPNMIKSVRLLTLDDKPLNMKCRYRVATNSYIPAISEVPEGAIHPYNKHTTDIIMSFLEKKKSVNYYGIRRLSVK